MTRVKSMPYVLVGDLHGDGVGGVGALALLPLHKAAKHTSRGATTSLSCDGGELSWVLLLGVVQLGQAGDETRQTGGRGGQSGTGGEGVHGRNVDVVLRPVLFLHEDFATGTVDSILSKKSDFLDASLATAIDFNLLTIQPQAISRKVLTCGYRCNSV